MGEIIDMRKGQDGDVICKLVIGNDEMKGLNGHMKNIQIFSEKMCDTKTNINVRGNKGVTKYFKIPLSIRSRKKGIKSLTYQKIENFSKAFYIYILSKKEI